MNYALPTGFNNLLSSMNSTFIETGFANSWSCATLIALGIFVRLIYMVNMLHLINIFYLVY